MNAKLVIWISCPMLFGACMFISDEELAYREGGAGCTNAWFLDSDSDGVGGSVSLLACESPGVEYTSITGDCDDSDPTVSPKELEDCGTQKDEDCDGTINGSNLDVDPIECTLWFSDLDGDGFGDVDTFVCNCASDDVYTIELGGDCYDQSSTVNPNQQEVCGDGLDNDCDGTANGCGYTSNFSFDNAIKVIGENSRDYAGTECTFR